MILTMLRYRDSKEELKHYIDENKKFFQNVDYETSQAMKAFLNMKQIPGEAEHKEEMVDMCKAIDKKMVIENTFLLNKTGGKSGEFNFFE